VRLLLDTHALIWALTKPDRLSKAAREAIWNDANDIFVSVVSPWEMAIKQSHDRLRYPEDLEAQFDRMRFKLLPVSVQHAAAVGSMPHHHRDPFDRMLIAQAQVEGLTIVTSDREMQRYQVALLPAI
jgi:PIN domain nuclease of toxin-antitoxin system